MMGIKERNFKVHSKIDLDELVPPDNFYRHLEQTLNLDFVRELVQDYYSPFGRPSIDPVVFFKLQLVMFFEGIRSERQLMEMVHLNLAYRWYIGYDLNEAVPDHSSLTKIRERYGLRVFRQFFEQIVERCLEAGLVWGQELYFDGTQVEANASLGSNVSDFEYQLRNHLNILFPDREPETITRPESDFLEDWVETYQHPPHWKQVDSAYQPIADQRTSLTDPDATPLRGKSRLGYHTH